MRLVILSAFNALVSDDLAACVAEWDPSAQIRVLGSHAEAAAALAAAPSVFAVLVQGRREDIMEADLPARVAERGGRLVWMAEWPPRSAQATGADVDWIRVDMPFGTEAILAALEAVADADDHLEREA